MNDACLDDRAVPHRIHRFGKALEAVADHHAHIKLRKVSETFADVPDGKTASHTLGVLANLLDPA